VNPTFPAVVYLSSLAPLLVVGALLMPGKWRSGHWWILVGCLTSLTGDGLGYYLGMQGRNNLWVSYAVAPVMYGGFLLALAEEQHRRLQRQQVLLVAGLMVVTTVVLGLTVDDPRNFSAFAVPLGSLLVLGVALLTLIRAGLGKDAPGEGWTVWLWVPLSLALFSGVTGIYLPLAAAVAGSDAVLLSEVWKVKSALLILVFALMAWGLVCQRRATLSGRSSLLSSSPSGSS
jgi:hypothetical protein